MVMVFLFFETLPSEEVTLHLGAIMESNKFSQAQHKQKRMNAQQSNMACSQELTQTALCMKQMAEVETRLMEIASQP